MQHLQTSGSRAVLGLQFGRDGRTLFAAWRDGFDVLGLDTGHREFVHWEKSNRLSTFTLDPLGRWLYVAGGDGGGMIIEVPAWTQRRFPGISDDNHVVGLADSPDGSRVAISRGPIWSNRIQCWLTDSDGIRDLGWAVSTASQRAMAHAMAFSTDSRRLVVAESRPRNREERDPFMGHIQSPWTLAVRDAATGEEIDVLGVVSQDYDLRLHFVEKDTALLLCYPEFIEVWDVASRAARQRIRAPGRSRFRDVAIHPSGKFIATASGEGTIRFWDAATHGELRRHKWGIGKPQSLAFSPDGMLAAVGSDTGKIVVWDVDL